MVDPVDDRCVNILAARCRDNDLLSAASQVCTGFFLTGEKSCALHDDIDAQFCPG